MLIGSAGAAGHSVTGLVMRSGLDSRQKVFIFSGCCSGGGGALNSGMSVGMSTPGGTVGALVGGISSGMASPAKSVCTAFYRC